MTTQKLEEALRCLIDTCVKANMAALSRIGMGVIDMNAMRKADEALREHEAEQQAKLYTSPKLRALIDRVEAEQQAGEAVVGSFMTREQAIEHCRKRRPGIEPTEQHIAATIDAYSALFGDLVPASTEAGVSGHVAWVVRVPGGYKYVSYESRVINKLAHGTLLFTHPQQPLTRELKELEADLNELSDGTFLCPGWDVRRLRAALGITKDTK